MRIRPGKLSTVIAVLAGIVMTIPADCSYAADYRNSFDRDSSGWTPVADGRAHVAPEPGTTNRVLELQPVHRMLSYVVFDGAGRQDAFRMTGRFLFPTEGDGYLGLIYGVRPGSDRNDYGCVYVKSNGSYIRFSPHFAGNPSWRLYEDLRINLIGDRAIRVGKWYDFKIEVSDSSVSLYIDDMASPVFATDVFNMRGGLVGLEARPGNGEPVWVDDIRIHSLGDKHAPPEVKDDDSAITAPFSGWQVYGETLDKDAAANPARLTASDNWSAVNPDKRGAVITAKYTHRRPAGGGQYLFGATFEQTAGESEAALAFSSANHLAVWLNGKYVGEVEPTDYIWADHATNPAHHGTRLPIRPVKGRNQLLIVVDPDRFAGGGFFITLDSA